MRRYNPKEIEPKWQKKWEADGVNKADDDPKKPKHYVLEYFPYPSGAAMHVGHVRNYTIGDAIARYSRMRGNNVLHPMGWDAFGLPAENYAIKNKVSPRQAIDENTKRFKDQLVKMGFSYDWSREIDSTDPAYYKWTQWFFLLLFKKGLAYQKESLQWWCPHDKTVLANEQVEAGRCWRCDNLVEKKPLKQWFFKITDYADPLLDDLDDLDWSDAIKSMQRNWIGKSKGAEVDFMLHEVANRNPDMARTYIMGQQKITKKDIELIGGRVESVTDGGHLCVEFPVSKSGVFEELINEKMEPGFWNEYLTNEEIVFIFKHKDGKLERFVLNDDNAHEIVALGHQFNDQPEPSPRETPWSWFIGNRWYAPLIPKLTVFTTRPDTLFGATFLVLAPEHPLVPVITSNEQKTAVEKYVKDAQSKSDIQRQETDREKTGVFTGAYAINPVNNEKIPIWVADYVLMGYGTGAIMAVPAHDDRDKEFAEKFELPIKQVIADCLIDTSNPPRSDKQVVSRKVVCMVVEHPEERQFLICKPHGGANWSPVMGGIDGNESIVEAAQRELIEETGYSDIETIEEKNYEFSSEFFAQHKDENRIANVKTVYIKLASLNKDETKAVDADKQELRWVTEEEYRQDKSTGGMQEVLDIGLGKEMPPVFEGRLVNSAVYDGIATSEARERIVTDLEKVGTAKEVTNYKIRDWLISRQRYWGAPIPIIHCPKDGPVGVPDEQLPVKLPEIAVYEPSGDGRSPLSTVPEFIKTTCPKCGGPAERETDTMDGFACSSWYFLRFADPHNEKVPFSKEKANFWLPVDDYIGGAEHAVMHLLYARFWTKVMYDDGLINFNEPFLSLRNQGMILAPDGQKMSKSKGNTIEPDELINQGYGADAVRLMELFIGPWNQAAAWSIEGMGGCFRFLQRVWTLTQEYKEIDKHDSDDNKKLTHVTHRTIYKVSKDFKDLSFNTAIAALMEYVNELYKLKAEDNFRSKDWGESLGFLVQMLAPLAPHISEELWLELGNNNSVHKSVWPAHNDKYLVSDMVNIVVQVNGKLRANISVPADSDETTAVEVAKKDEKIQKYLVSEPKKTIFVKNRLINFVV